MPKRISEQAIVITGASSGIGLACAREFARRGAKVVLAARNTGYLQHAADEIRREGGEAIAVTADVTQYEQVQDLATRAVQEFGRIDTWINGAAVSVYGTFKEVPVEDARRVMDTNFFGQVHGAKAALPHLERTAGALICIGSAAGDRGLPLQGAYSASKHAIKGWLDSLRVELKQEGSRVRVTLVKPSSINTPLFRHARTYLGVEPRPFPPVYEPELVVAAILRAAEGNIRDVPVGGSGKFLSVAESLSPEGVDLYMRAFGARSQRTDWPKTSQAASNLSAPAEHEGDVHGDFGIEAKTRSPYQAFALSKPLTSAALGAGLIAAIAIGLARSR